MRNHFLPGCIILCILILLLGSSSCVPVKDYSSEYLYFQDADSLRRIMVSHSEYRIQKDDVLGIGITSASMNQDQLLPFNAVVKTESNTQAVALPDYTVDAEGNIQLPLVGKVQVAGYTQKEAQQILEAQLGSFISKPGVYVTVKNFSITVLGEVRSPGRHLMPNTNATLLDALAAAGDLSPSANRRDILLMRKNTTGETEFIRLDITRIASLMDQQHFQLAQNDVLYVAPNKQKINDAMQDENDRLRRFQVAFTIVSTVTVLVNLLNALF